MSANPQVVTVDTAFVWDGVTQRLARGTVLDVPPNSPLLGAIGLENLTPMFRAGSTALPPEQPAEAPEDAPAKDETPATAAKKTAAKTTADTPEKGAADAKEAAP